MYFASLPADGAGVVPDGAGVVLGGGVAAPWPQAERISPKISNKASRGKCFLLIF